MGKATIEDFCCHMNSRNTLRAQSGLVCACEAGEEFEVITSCHPCRTIDLFVRLIRFRLGRVLRAIAFSLRGQIQYGAFSEHTCTGSTFQLNSKPRVRDITVRINQLKISFMLKTQIDGHVLIRTKYANAFDSTRDHHLSCVPAVVTSLPRIIPTAVRLFVKILRCFTQKIMFYHSLSQGLFIITKQQARYNCGPCVLATEWSP